MIWVDDMLAPLSIKRTTLWLCLKRSALCTRTRCIVIVQSYGHNKRKVMRMSCVKYRGVPNAESRPLLSNSFTSTTHRRHRYGLVMMVWTPSSPVAFDERWAVYVLFGSVRWTLMRIKPNAHFTPARRLRPRTFLDRVTAHSPQHQQIGSRREEGEGGDMWNRKFY